jgi:hypothetical protein
VAEIVATLWASLGKDAHGKAEHVQVGSILEQQDGSRYISMNRLFNYGMLPGGDVKRFYLQIRQREPGEEG